MMKITVKHLERIGKILLAIGILLFAYSLTLSPYTDQKDFNNKVMSMEDGKSEAYWALRDEMLTPKYRLVDYSITLILIGFLFFLIKNQKIVTNSPKSKEILIALASGLPFLTITAVIFDLFLGASRGEFPPWADSLGIPLASMPIQLLILFLWSFLMFGLRIKKFSSSTPIINAISLKANWWFLLISAITFALTSFTVAMGHYYFTIPGLIWLYYYLSLATFPKHS